MTFDCGIDQKNLVSPYIIKKIRAEINAKETKETIAKIDKAKSQFFEKLNKIDKQVKRTLGKQKPVCVK